MPKHVYVWLDRLMDVTVFPNYSRWGYLLRQRMWEDKSIAADMRGKTCLITGASAGIGRAGAGWLASLGAGVHLVCRDSERGKVAREAIVSQTGNQRVFLHIADVSSMDQVRTLAAELAAGESQLDVLINNAGIFVPERRLSADGVEQTFATNVLGPFALTNLLLPLVTRARGRVILVSSAAMYTARLHPDDLQFQRRRYRGALAYAETKRALAVLNELWAQRLQNSPVSIFAMHPGWVHTPGLSRSLPIFSRLFGHRLRTPAQGADTIVWLAAAREPASQSGGFWFDRCRRTTNLLPWTKSSPATRRALWAECVRLSGTDLVA